MDQPLKLLVLHVQVEVKPECVAAFRTATLQNAQASVKEPGIARFDVLQDRDDPTRFALVEVYRSDDAPLAHKQTPHYEAWRVAVEPMLATPRTRRTFDAVFPDPDAW